MLTVGLDLRAVEPGFKAHYGRGTWRYASELSQQLLDPGRLDAEGWRQSELRVIGVEASQIMSTGWEQKLLSAVPFGKSTLETQLFLPRRLRNTGVDLLHFFAHVDAPSRSSIPYLVTVLDLIPLKFRDLYKAEKSGFRFRLARYLEQQAILNALGYLAISECTKRDMVELLGIAADDIVVTPLAVGSHFRARSLEDEALLEVHKQALGLPLARPLVLYVGGIDPRKNVMFLLEVFAEVLRSGGLSVRPLLVLAGAYANDEHYPELVSSINALGLEADVKLQGFVSDEMLLNLYHTASISVFPNLYEGFGLPVLEAMACGVPVVAGNNSSLPEVVGLDRQDAPAVLVEDKDLQGWVQAILELLSDSARQSQMARLGVERAKAFSGSVQPNLP